MATNFQIACEREDLLTALQSADAVVPTNSPKEILKKVLLSANNGQLMLAATDQQVGLRAILRRVEVQSPGEVILPAKHLVGILKESRSPTVELVSRGGGEAGGEHVGIELADGRYQLPAHVGEAFPLVTGFPSDLSAVMVPGPVLERLLRKVSFAVDKERTSAVLSGVLTRIGDGECLAAATDGKVLAEAVQRDPAYAVAPGSEQGGIIPASTIAHVLRILGAMKPELVELVVTPKVMCIRCAGGGGSGPARIQVELSSRQVEGNYPSYRNALPLDPKGRAWFSAEELGSAVRRTALMTTSSSRTIIFDLSPERAVLSNLTATGGSARIPLPCRLEGQPIRFGLNADYLGEVLRAYEANEVQMELNGPGRGIIMREPGVTFLVMPITLPN